MRGLKTVGWAIMQGKTGDLSELINGENLASAIIEVSSSSAMKEEWFDELGEPKASPDGSSKTESTAEIGV
jgi:hypothetical protein